MSIRRVAIIFDSQDRPETTGVYVRRALGELVETAHIEPEQQGAVISEGFDLYVHVDDGHDLVLPQHMRPAVFWAIDTHMDLDRYVRRASHYDLIFTAQRDGAELLQQRGIPATWLPLACDPTIHHKHKLAKQHDICFIGNLVFGARVELLELLKRHFPKMLVDRRYFEEMAKAYSASRLVFNRSIKNDINMRVFEGVACGSLLLTNDLLDNGQHELFQDAVHLATYQGPEVLIDKARYYLEHARQREKIAKAGQQEAHAKHTYRHRVQQLLQAAEQLLGLRHFTAPQAPAQTAKAGFATDSIYYEYVRPEVLALVPTTARRVLDIGCGAGCLGEVIKRRQGAEVLGIEYVSAAAAQAHCRLDRVFEGDVETMSIDIEPESLDAVICADVLEHLRQPLTVLKRVKNWVKPKGRLIVSLPNVRHHTVVRGLLEGHWKYEPAGLLDATHLQFFTRREMEKLLDRAGFDIHEIQMVPGAEHALWERQGRKGEIKLGRLFVGGMTPEEAEEFHVFQYLFTATPKPPVDYGLTSIILATHNGLRDTRECISSLVQSTDEPFELICIDNGSTDGTPEYLESLANTKVIRNGDNRGFPAAVNQGIAIAQGNQVLLLNNDTVVTTGWLSRLLAALHSHDRIGLVGPVSNCAPGAQRVRDLPYSEDLIGMDGFAWDLARSQAKQRQDVETLSGFCLLLRRQMCAELGPFDERFGIGTLEDDDYCLRAKKAGWRVIVAQDVYIHHAGHRTFHALGMDFDALAAGNAKLFDQKWRQKILLTTKTWEKTSIVIVTHGELSHTQACIESIRQHTPEPHEIIVVDNASPDQTQEWLRGQSDVTLIANPQNRGFPAAANQGLRAAMGSQLLFLNNDTRVTPGWLRRLLEALYAEPNTGLVGPCSNRISGEQQVAVDYDQESCQGLDAFANRWAQQHENKREPTDRLVGFCLLLKRAVIEKIGNFDEQFGIGNFEDDDLCLRAMQAGFTLAIARDAFVHHVGHATFRGAGVDFAELMQRNQKLFEKKWAKQPPPRLSMSALGKPHQVGYCLADTGNPEDLLLERREKRLSLCMIVRDNEKTLPACLESIRPYVDEMNVVDTGSKDDTPKIARRLGARVYHFPWIDDFSAARNESLKYARGQWCFWMDSDDVITPECGKRLRELAYGPHPEHVMGYLMQVHCPGPGDDGHLSMTAVDHVKLIRNRPDLRFDGRIHEQLMQPIRQAGGEIVLTDIYVTHAGYDHSPEGQKRKLERDLRLLHKELAERPDHTFTLFNLGMTYGDTPELGKAADFLERSIAAAGPTDSHLRKAYALLVMTHTKAHNLAAAQAACNRGLARFPLDVELRFHKARLLHDAGRVEEALHVYQDVLTRHEERHLTSVDRGLVGFKTRQNMASCLSDLGDLQSAEEQWRLVVREVPDYRAGWRSLADILIKQKRPEEAVKLAQQVADRPELAGEGELIMGYATLAIGDWRGARQWFHSASEIMPKDTEPLLTIGRICFERGYFTETEPYLRKILELNPSDASTWHNLGSLLLHTDRKTEALEALRESLRLRPGAEQTETLLAMAQQS